MPTYEYECPKCGTYDVEQRITAAPLTTCEACGQPVRRLISRTSFALKGAGWYSDGYGSSSGGGAKKADAACSKPECGTGACAGAAGTAN